MQSVYRITKDYIYTPNLPFVRELSIAAISDIHLSKLVTDKDFSNLYYQLKKIEPNYICMMGDNLDSTNILDDEEKVHEYLNFLEELGGKVAPVLVGLGGHDFRRYHIDEKGRNHSGSKKEQIAMSNFEWNGEFWNAVSSLSGVTLVTNSFLPSVTENVFDIPQIYIAGFTQSDKYFHTPNNVEDVSVMREDLTNFIDSISPLPTDKPKIIMIHSPLGNKDPVVRSCLTKFDLVLHGHMHGGLVFPGFYELVNNNFGFVAPGKLANRPDTFIYRKLESLSSTRSLLPECARGTMKISDENGRETTAIISSGIVKIQDCAPRILKPFDYLYPRDINEIILTDDLEKSKTKRQYQYSLSKKN